MTCITSTSRLSQAGASGRGLAKDSVKHLIEHPYLRPGLLESLHRLGGSGLLAALSRSVISRAVATLASPKINEINRLREN